MVLGVTSMGDSNEQDRLKDAIEQSFSTGDLGAVRGMLVELIDRWPSLENVSLAARRLRELDSAGRAVKVAVVAGSVVATVQPYLELETFRAELHADVWFSDSGQFTSVIFDEPSPLVKFRPDLVFLAPRLTELHSQLDNSVAFLDFKPEDVQRELEQATAELLSCIRRIRQWHLGPLVVHNFMVPPRSVYGIAEPKHSCGQKEAIVELNRRLAQFADDQADVYVFDFDQLTAQVGKESCEDPRFAWADLILAPEHLPRLAIEYARYILPLTGRNRKVAVVDLDNTLWRGVLAEDGVENLVVDDSALLLQRELLCLKKKGVLLAMNSKNDERNALNALETHPDMLLRKEHFAAWHIDAGPGTDKVSGLERIASDLCVGVDSLVFVDDDPWQCSSVRRNLPVVRVVQLPSEVYDHARAIQAIPDFEVLHLTEETRRRTETLQAEREIAMSRLIPDLKERRRRANARLLVATATRFDLPRLCELVLRVNRFNLTGRRYSSHRLESFLGDETWRLFVLRLVSYGVDFGRVALAVTAVEDEAWRLDNLLASCRTPQELSVEYAFLLTVMQQAREAGVRRIIGQYRSTPKNAQVKNFYAKVGFDPIAGTTEPGQDWQFKLSQTIPEQPEFLEVAWMDNVQFSRSEVSTSENA